MKRPCLFGTLCLFASLVIWSPVLVHAGTLIYSGADLYNHPDVSFPSVTPSLNGDSLIFGTGNSNDRLLVLPLFPAGTIPQTQPANVSITINITRLGCSGYCVGGSNDHDPMFLLGDGSYLVGALASDDNGGQGSVVSWADSGSSVSSFGSNTLFTNAGFPNIGDSIDVYITYTLSDQSTEVGISFLGGSGSTTSLAKLNVKQELAFVLLRDNDAGEQYQINSLTISSPALVPIPPALWLFGSGLLGLVGMARRRS